MENTNKKAVITILGTIGSKKPINNQYFPDEKNNIKNSIYVFDGNEYNFINTLPLLIDIYGKTYNIEAFYTDDSKRVQEKILEYENQSKYINIFNNQECYINSDDEKNNKYDKIFKQIDNVISKYNSVVIDVTHGFRHLPILMTIDLIIQNIKNTNKIERRYFKKF
jgi:CRISPR-associated DxTHG motif protein